MEEGSNLNKVMVRYHVNMQDSEHGCENFIHVSKAIFIIFYCKNSEWNQHKRNRHDWNIHYRMYDRIGTKCRKDRNSSP